MATPNLYEDNKGKVTKESGGSGGGIPHFNREFLYETESQTFYMIHGATINDLKSVFYLDMIEDGEPLTILFGYTKLWGGNEELFVVSDGFYGGPYFIDEESGDGVKVHAVVIT